MVNRRYDFLIVGSGLFGAVFAYKARQSGKKVLVIEKRPHLGGNVFCKEEHGIQIHKYGAHIFHTNNKKVWDFVNQFVSFNNYIHTPLAKYENRIYHLPFNMNTFSNFWNYSNTKDIKEKINQQRREAGITNPKNLEEQAISSVGKEIYLTLIKGYTEKQWGRKCEDLPAFIIKRLPVRFNFNNNYFNDYYQGIPIGGYNKIIDKLLEKIETKTDVDFFKKRSYWESVANTIVYTGKIDEFYNYYFGELKYRTLNFKFKTLNREYFQENAVVNYTDSKVPYTRIIEHKYFETVENKKNAKTVISKEFPKEYSHGKEALYPINDKKNQMLYKQYHKLAKKEKNVIFGGRLAEYKYYNMDEVIEKALLISKTI